MLGTRDSSPPAHSPKFERDPGFLDEKARGLVLACLPPAASRIKGTPQEVPLNRTAMLALGAEIASPDDGRVFRRWTHRREFKEYWSETCRRVGMQGLRHTFPESLPRTKSGGAPVGHRMPGHDGELFPWGPGVGSKAEIRRGRIRKNLSVVLWIVL